MLGPRTESGRWEATTVSPPAKIRESPEPLSGQIRPVRSPNLILPLRLTRVQPDFVQNLRWLLDEFTAEERKKMM
jgi:hypothetical protein